MPEERYAGGGQPARDYTPFDMKLMNGLDCDRLVLDVVALVLGLAQDPDGGTCRCCRAKLDGHHAYIRVHGVGMPDVRDWHCLA